MFCSTILELSTHRNHANTFFVGLRLRSLTLPEWTPNSVRKNVSVVRRQGPKGFRV